MCNEIICAAVTGDPQAVEAVLRHYHPYIVALASRWGYLDIEAVCCLEARLLYALPKFRVNPEVR